MDAEFPVSAFKVLGDRHLTLGVPDGAAVWLCCPGVVPGDDDAGGSASSPRRPAGGSRRGRRYGLIAPHVKCARARWSGLSAPLGPVPSGVRAREQRAKVRLRMHRCAKVSPGGRWRLARQAPRRGRRTTALQGGIPHWLSRGMHTSRRHLLLLMARPEWTSRPSTGPILRTTARQQEPAVAERPSLPSRRGLLGRPWSPGGRRSGGLSAPSGTATTRPWSRRSFS
jgi:hypothetical protein